MTETTVRQKATLWLAIVFVLGAALGGVLGYAFAHRSYAAEPTVLTAEARRAQKREQMAREVGLTPEQLQQVSVILDGAQTEYKAVHAVMDPQIDAVRQKSRDKIRALMTPEQKPKLEEFLRKLDEERKRIGQ
jgi:Spy/CpxP family protein refolding chaperone